MQASAELRAQLRLLGEATKQNLPPEGAAGCKIEGWGLLERSPLERPALSLIARGRQRTQAADWIKLLTEQDVKIAGRCKLRGTRKNMTGCSDPWPSRS